MSEILKDRIHKSPFLIIGSGSSGTTLLSILLDKHSLIACGPELSVFNKQRIYDDYTKFTKMLPIWLKKGLSTDGQAEYREFFFNLEAYCCTQEQLFEFTKNSTNLRDFFDQFFLYYLQQRKKIIFGEKTGSNSYCLKYFLKLYPQAPIIHIVRDGRDVICSLMDRGNSAFHSVSHWLYNVSASIRYEDQDNYLQIHYENLITQPKEQLIKICQHLGVDYEDKMLDEEAGNLYWKKCSMLNVHNTWKSNPLNKLSSKSIGRHQIELSEEIETLFWKISLTPFARYKLQSKYKNTVELMEHLGYIDEKSKLMDRTVQPKYYIEGIKTGIRRLKNELKYEHRYWLPLTWIQV